MLKTDNNMRVLTLLLGLMLALPIVAFGQEVDECNGPYKGNKRLTEEELNQVLETHKEWSFETHLSQKKDSTDPRRANLCEADLSRADLSGAILSAANLSRAILFAANLSEANLIAANLSGAVLMGANLTDADLNLADLTDAILFGANLTNAGLADANLTGANLIRADLSGAIYDPESEKQPSAGSIAKAKGLSELTYRQPEGLVNLRKLFKDGGYKNQERQITYAIHHVRNNRLLDNIGGVRGEVGSGQGLPGQIEGAFNYVLFDLTTKWGLAPSRALIAIFVLILIFTLPYAYAVRAPKKDGIWRFWVEERARTDLGSKAPELLCATGIHAITLPLYFSFLSAFHIGWRDLNVGNWITRVQPREYTLRASGWVRTVSGIQSLLSVYLLAIWALTYFGRPFE